MEQIILELSTMSSVSDYDESTIIKVLDYLDAAYTAGDPKMSDADYDVVRHEASLMYPNNKYFKKVGAEAKKGAVLLPYTMGSLIQAHDADVNKWISGTTGTNNTVVVVKSDKLDGISGLLTYNADGKFVAAYTRGDAIEGDDITHHVRNIPFPKQLDVHNTTLGGHEFGVRVEIIIKKSRTDFLTESAKYRSGKSYSNLRNGVAGLMNRDDPLPDNVLYDMIDLVAYEIKGNVAEDQQYSKLEQYEYLNNLGFNIAHHEVEEVALPTGMNIQQLTDFTERRVAESEYELDGVVLDINQGSVRAAMGMNGLFPTYSRKFKINSADSFVDATVVDVEWNISKHGYLNPTAILEPVQLAGATITRATLHNAKNVVDNEIGIGSVVKLVRSGGVIPYIAGVISPATHMVLPDQYEYEWNETEVDFVLTDMSSVVIEDVQVNLSAHFFKTMQVDNIAEGQLTRLFQEGYQTFVDVIQMSEADLINALNSKAIGTTIYNNIQKQFWNTPISLAKLAGASGMFGRGVGVRKMEQLAESCSSDDEFLKLLSSHTDIMKVKGFDTKTANKIVSGFDKFNSTLLAVFNQNCGKIVHIVDSSSLPLNGVSIAFTEIRSKKTEELIKSLGGKVASSVSRKTKFLVSGNPEGSTGKSAKAIEYGVPIISLDELQVWIDETIGS